KISGLLAVVLWPVVPRRFARDCRTRREQPLRMPVAVSGETSGSYKPQDHGEQPGNILQDHHNNSGRESLSQYIH
ncbi:hypothetical protein L9F63_022722, partial [Diploptera punctata]